MGACHSSSFYVVMFELLVRLSLPYDVCSIVLGAGCSATLLLPVR